MPLDGVIPYRFRPRSLADTLDGSNARPGACSNLSNLIPDPSTLACFQCRPAAVPLSTFAGFTTPGVVSVAMRVGTRIYGMIASGRNAGLDEPFIYDLVGGAFITVSNVTANNCPTTQPTSGDWTPPTMDMVGQQIFVTHPGFSGVAGGKNAFFGIFDVTGFSETITGNITTASKIITGNPDISGVFGGMPISGVGIPANSFVTNKSNVSYSSVGTTNGTTTLAITSGAVPLPGQLLSGVGIAAGSFVVSVSGSNVTMNLAATGSATGVAIFVTGTTITINNNATATTPNLSISIAGGTFAAPLWTASNTTGAITLAQPPTNVRQFSNRAYFSQAQYVIFTDTFSTNCTLATQILTIGDADPVTALCPLGVISSTNAIIQGLLIFKNNLIELVTGDSVTGNLTLNTLSPQGVGTSSSRAVCVTPLGVLFPDNDGIRVVQITGNVTDPLDDVRIPFVYAISPSRMSGSYDNGVYRICVQNGNAPGNPFQEFWFDFKQRMWTGPHTFRQDMAVPNNGSFVCFSNPNPATMYKSDVVQNSTSAFTENGAVLNWTYATSTLPDADNVNMNSCIIATINIGFQSGAPQIQCTASDPDGNILNSVIIYPPAGASIWGSFIWGAALWFGQQFGLGPYQITWTNALVFSRMVVAFSSQSSLGFRISNLTINYQPLGYVASPVVPVMR